MLPQPPNSNAHVEFVKQLADWETKNIEPYDKAILTLSSGALALSLSFIKDLVPPQSANLNWLLYTAWLLFVVALAVNISGFIYTLRSFRMQRRMGHEVFKQGKKSVDDLENLFQRHYRVVFWLNVSQGIAFVLGMVALTCYVIVNFQSQRAATGTGPQDILNAPSSARARANYELSEKCTRSATQWFEQRFAGKDQGDYQTSNHYSVRLNHCFVLLDYAHFIESTATTKGYYSEGQSLVDAQENRFIGIYHKTTNSVAPSDCKIDGRACKSEADWKEGVRRYMED